MAAARKEVLVQLDDQIVVELDLLARAQGTSRSDLVRRGVLAVLEAANEADADRTLQHAYRRQPPEPAVVEAAARLAATTTPPW